MKLFEALMLGKSGGGGDRHTNIQVRVKLTYDSVPTLFFPVASTGIGNYIYLDTAPLRPGEYCVSSAYTTVPDSGKGFITFIIPLNMTLTTISAQYCTIYLDSYIPDVGIRYKIYNFEPGKTGEIEIEVK